jgi:hypothetical protein
MTKHAADLWIEEMTSLDNDACGSWFDDPHADCLGPDHCCPECLAGYHRDMAEQE